MQPEAKLIQEKLFFRLNSSKMQPNALLAWQNFIMEKDEWKPLCRRVGHYTLVNDGLL
jgi:hypothetical protein